MKRNDVILIVVLLAVSLSLYAVVTLYQQKTTQDGEAVVYIDGEEVGRYPLNQDVTKKITQDKETYNTLVIKDGKAYITKASCPDLICVHHRGISKKNESIVCLPNKLVIKIENAPESDVDISTN